MATFEKILRRIKQYSIGLEIEEYKTVRSFFTNKTGIEIGGPSQIFKANNILPIYTDAKHIDGVNFSNLTVWENKIEGGQTYDYGGFEKGYQFIAEASALTNITEDSYDFLLSSHSLEHCANVLKTLIEWKRVIRSGGAMLVVVPNRQFTFDHNRSITTFEHLLEDYKKNVNEGDLTHLQEIIDKHDISLDAGVISKEQFIQRSMQNIENRCLHHHVFDIELLLKIFHYLNMNVLFTSLQPPYHMVIMVQKL